MENKDQNNAVPLGQSLGDNSLSSDMLSDEGGVVQAPLDPNALSYEPGMSEPLNSQEQQRRQSNPFLRFVRRADVLLVGLLLLGVIAFLFTMTRHEQSNNDATVTADDKFSAVQIPLGELTNGKNLSLAGAANVTINGPIQLNDGLYVTPTLQPTGAKAGQIYYDKGNNQLAYFNGEGFVFLTGQQPQDGGVQSLGGGTGQLTLGGGLTLANNQLANSGVLSVQGQNGAVTFTAGAGIVINGTNFSNSGVLSIAAGSPNVHVSSDGAGKISLSVDAPVAGTGTITSSGGTIGHLPLFTASQNIEDSIVTQSGLTVTISGDLSVVTGGLTLSNALTVSNGGTGTNSLAANGVLVGHGTAAVSSVAAAGAGLCLVSTAGVPTWAACPSGNGVNSLNGLTGGLNIANASGVGTTITIDDASTVNKGIASFNGTNFSVAGGAVNTIQNINSGATPTFAGVNTNNITPNAALTVGVSAQTALLQGSTTTITSSGAGNNIVLNSAATIELQDNTNVTGNVTTSGDLAVNGGDITSSGALNITPGGALTIGSSTQALTLQGGATSTFRATNGASTTVVGFTSPTANTTLNFPALTAGTYTICTSSGNCSGAGVTLQAAYSNSTDPEITLDATRGALTLRDNSTPLGANLLEVQNNTGSATYLAVTANGISVTGTASVSSNINSSTGALQTNGTTRIDNAGNGVNLGSITLSGAISGGTTITGSGNINSTGGTIQTNGTTRIDNSGNLVNIVAITASGSATFQGGSATLGTNSQAGTVVLNDGSSNTGTLAVAALGQNTIYTLPDPGAGAATICLSSGNCAGVGGGVTSPGGTTNKLSKFTGSNTIGDSSITDDGTDVSVSVDVIIQGGDLTVGTTSQQASIVLHDGNGQTTTLQAGDSVGNMTFILPTNTGSANQCLKQSGTGNQLVWQDCDGGAGGSSATLQTTYNNSTNPEIVLNSSVGGLTIRDNSTPLGSNLFEIQNNAGSTTYLAVTVTGVSVNGTATATGNINTSGGALQTNGTTRIDNSGNAVNIGNITGSGAMTIASIGAGNDITIDGADQFIVQDASVFNALTTFNANIDLGGNDIVGTTGNINLTNFDVAGATGNVTAGTYNGQTISSSANFTGTVAVAGNTTLTGDLAINGGDITSTGALNITPGGTLTVGVTGQQLILQGSANTQLTATGGGFTTAVGFNGVPTGAVTYNFDRSAAPGTYTICTTVGNCSGSGGVTTTGGTTGTIAVFTGSQTLGDSLLSQSGSTVTVNGNLNLVSGNQFQVNGTQISSSNLSNDSNLAKLSASQIFTGNTVTFQNAADSTNAFSIQNSSGNRILSADSSNAYLVLGDSNNLDGTLVFENMSNSFRTSIVPGTPTANRTLTLPDVSGVICTDSGNCAGAGATLQTAYNFSVGGTTPKIKLDSTLLGVDIQDADTTIGANLFNVRASNASGLGSVLFGVGNTGQVTLQNSSNTTTAFRILTSGGTNVFAADTNNGRVVLGQASTLSGSIVFQDASSTNTAILTTAALTGNQTITLPNATGTVCLSSGNCSGSGSSNTLQAAYDAGNTIAASNSRDLLIQMADTATDPNFLIDLQCDTTCGGNGRFAIQDDGTDVFAISPGGGSIAIQPTVASTSALNLKTILGNNLFTVDTLNSRIGFNLGGNNVPVLAGTEPGIELHNGVLRLSGTSGMDSYTTPAGANVATKISVETHNLPNFGQIMALGIGSTSDVSSRVISLFDARTVRHQPTLAVFSPDENNSVGFSWNGSNATASVQTSDNTTSTKNLIVQSGNVSSSGGNSGDLQLNTGSIGGTGFTTGAIYLVSGDGVGTNNSSGNVTVDSGVSTGSGTRGTVNIGTQNTNSVLIGRAAGTTTFQGGTTNVTGVLAANGDVSLGDAAADLITIAGTIQGGSPLVFEGATADANELTLSIAALSADRTITLPNEDGTVCLQNATSCGFVTGTTASFIQNQNSAQQTSSNYWISGTGRADVALQAPSIDTATSAALSIGTGNASSVTIGSTTNNTPVTINSGTGAISIGTGSNNRTVNIATGNAVQNVTVGSTASSSQLVLQGGTNGVKITTAGTVSAFLVQDTAGQALFNIDASNGWTVNNGNIHPNNLIENPSFEAAGAYTATGWNFSSQATISNAGTPHHGNNELVYTPNGTLLVLSSFKYLEAQPGDSFYAEVWYKVAAGTNGGGSFSYTYYDKNKTNIGSSSPTNFSTANTSYTLATVTGTAPANTAYVRLTTGINATSTTGNWFFDDYTLVRTNQQAPFNFKNTVNSTTAMQVQNATGGVVLDVDTTNGRVGIGTNTPGAQLDVAGQIPTSAAASVFASNLVYSVATAGKYAYSANFAALQAWDITRPTAPVSLGTTSTTNSGVSFLKVYGKYAFDMVTTWDSLDIFDISYPGTPVKIKNMTITSMQDLVVSGRYMYVSTSNTNKDLLVYDIINPSNPVLLATLPQTYSLSDMEIQGRYLYASAYSGITPRFVILDMANPASPSLAGSVAATGIGLIAVSGRYAYIASGTTVQAFNTANPASPASVGSVTVGGTPNDITVQDRTAYVSIGTSGIAVVNISNPASMTLTGTIATGTEIRGIAAQGRYIYASDYGNSKLNTYDIGGTFTQALEVGSVAAANVDVSGGLKVAGTVELTGGARIDGNTAVNGNLSVNGTQAIAVNSTATTGLPLLLQQSGTGDTGLELKNSVTSYYAGIDSSDNSKFKISSSNAGGTAIMGYNTVGASTDTNDSNVMNATKFTASSNGTISTLYARVGATIGSSPNDQAQMALFTDSAGSPGTLLASSSSATLAANSWNAFNITPTTIVSGTTYWIAYNTNGTTSAQNDLVYDSGTVNQSKFVARTFGTWPGTWSSGTFANVKMSMYGVIDVSTSSDNLNNGLFELTNNGQATFRNNSDTTSAFRILNAAGTNTVLNADTTNSRVGVGTAAPTRTLDVAVSTTSTNTLPLLLQQAGSGDVGLELKSTSKNYYVGVDNTDGAFKIASSTSANGSFTVGNTAIDPNTDSNANGAQAYKVTAGGTGTVSSVSVYIDSLDATPANRLIQVGVYTDNGSGTSPSTRLGASVSQTAVVGWNTISVSGVNVTSGTTYWIAMAENGATKFRVNSSLGGGNVVAYRVTGGYPLPASYAADSANSTDRPSFYMTVANAGGTDNFNGTNLLSMSDFGATTFQNSSNSASAFRVLNAAGVSQFIVDTNSSAVYIGASGSGTTSLTVSGATTMQGSATVSGNLNAGSIDGAGLTDCDSTNSKLLWDATTKQFSCGTDRASATIYKTADEIVNNSVTPQNDDDFKFTVGANETWAYQIYTAVKSTAAAGFSSTVVAPAGATCAQYTNDLYEVIETPITTCGASNSQTHSDGADHEYIIYGTIKTAGTGGTVNWQWAQDAATAVNTIVRGKTFMVAYKITGADLAEAYYSKDSSVGPGDIVQIDGSLKAGVKKSDAPYQSGAIGIISTKPGQILSDDPTPNSKAVLLALAGRIPVKVSLENGPIKAGDYLTTSSTPGVAMKATKAGQMIGKALEDFNSSNPDAQGTVMTFANLTYADPAANVTANNDVQGSTSMSNLNVSDTITTKDLKVTGTANINNLIVGSMTVSDITTKGNANFEGDINLQGVGLARNAITKKFVATHPIAIGAVVIADPDHDGQVTTTTTAADTRVLGVALTAADAGDEVTVAIGGSVQVQTVQGAVIKSGDLLGSSTTDGAADKLQTPLPGSLVGKALSQPAGDMTWILISLQ